MLNKSKNIGGLFELVNFFIYTPILYKDANVNVAYSFKFSVTIAAKQAYMSIHFQRFSDVVFETKFFIYLFGFRHMVIKYLIKLPGLLCSPPPIFNVGSVLVLGLWLGLGFRIVFRLWFRFRVGLG